MVVQDSRHGETIVNNQYSIARSFGMAVPNVAMALNMAPTTLTKIPPCRYCNSFVPCLHLCVNKSGEMTYRVSVDPSEKITNV
jgi:hypothetical protein